MNEISPEQQLQNLSNLVVKLTTPTRRNTSRADNYAAGKEEIADAARQLAETIQQYLAGELKSIDDESPF